MSMSRGILGITCTRYAWLLGLGALVGAGGGMLVAGGGHLWGKPRYTAVIPFEVLPPAPVIGTDMVSPGRQTVQEVAQVIHHQEFVLHQDNLLKDILASRDFHPDAKPNQECQWLSENKTNPVSALKRDLVVVGDPLSGAFELRMTAHDPVESCMLVQAAANVYLQHVKADEQARRGRLLNTVGQALRDAEATFQIKRDALADYQKRHGIDMLNSQMDIEKSALMQLDVDYTRADLMASGAEAQDEAVKKVNNQEIALPADMMKSIDDDATLRTLLQTRFTLEQERAGAIIEARGTPGSSTALLTTDARIKEVDREIDDLRHRLTDDARDRHKKMLADEAKNARFLADYLQKIRDGKKDVVSGLGQDLNTWQAKVDELKQYGEIVAALRRQFELASANQAMDDTRIAQLDPPVIPDSPDYPDLAVAWTYVPVGAGIGLLGALLLSLGLAERYCRKSNAPPVAPDAPPAPAA